MMKAGSSKNKIFLVAQTSLEYAILIVIIVAALLTSQVYVKRALQGRWKQAMDNVADQYDYWSTFSNLSLYTQSNTVSNVIRQGLWLRRDEELNAQEKKYGNEVITGSDTLFNPP